MPNPDNAGTDEINKERVSVAYWGKCNETKFNELVGYIRTVMKGRS